MSAPLRIYSHANMEAHLGPEQEDKTNGLKKYTDRLIKLVPAEIVGLYLAGKTAIASRFPAGPTPDPNAILSEPRAWVIWTVFCFIAVIGIRIWATSDSARNVPPEKAAVFIATVSFVIWVYSFGDVFRIVLHIWDPLIATFAVLAWTFIVPAVYGRDA